MMKPERSASERAAEPKSGTPTALANDLLERVVQQTLDSGAIESCAESWTALLNVARRFPERKLEVAPVLVALVKAILGSDFQRALRNDDAWDQMTTHIATTLFDDMAACDRLNSLWARLQEDCRE